MKWRELAVVGDGQEWIDRMEERERRERQNEEILISDGKSENGSENENEVDFSSSFFWVKNIYFFLIY